MQGLTQKKTETRAEVDPLDHLRRGIIARPLRVLIYGPEKVGKSTFASGAPKPIFLSADSGTEHLAVTRFPAPESWEDALRFVRRLQVPGHGFETLVIDPINFLEPLVHAFVTGSPDIAIDAMKSKDANGYVAAKAQFEILKKALELVWLSGMNIVIVGHSETKRHDPVDGESFDRFTLAMNDKCGAIFKRWVDSILFVRQDSFGKVDPKTKKTKAAGTGATFIYSKWSPAFDAGNRARLPDPLPLSWRAFAEAHASGTVEHARILAQIDADLETIGDATVERKVRGYLEDVTIDVAEVANGLRARIEKTKTGDETK